MAVPHVAGTAALMIGSKLLGEQPLSRARSRSASSRPPATSGAPGYDSRTAAGLLNAAAAATAPLP